MTIALVSFRWKPGTHWAQPRDVRWDVYDVDGVLLASNCDSKEGRWIALRSARAASVKFNKRVRVQVLDWDQWSRLGSRARAAGE